MRSWTGIPIEALFGLVGALMLLLYGDLRWNQRKHASELSKLRGASARRGKQLAVFRIYLSQLCSKAGIHFEAGEVDDNGNGDT